MQCSSSGLTSLKNFSIVERVKAQLRGEFFNFPNHASFGNPATNISVPSLWVELPVPAIRAKCTLALSFCSDVA